MNRLKCIIIDDEPPALNKVKFFIGKTPFLEFVGSFLKGSDAINYIENNPVDLVFVDMNLGEISGIELVQSLNKKPIIIITTAYDNYAVKGFEICACDYILKPFDFERFLQSSVKALTHYIAFSNDNVNNSDAYQAIQKVQKLEYLYIKSSHKLLKVKINEILYFKGMRDYILIQTESGKLLILSSFIDLEQMLPEGFLRIHKSYIIATDKIEMVENRRVKIGKEFIPISNSYYDFFIHYLNHCKVLG